MSKFDEIAKGTERTRRNLFKAGAKLGLLTGAAMLTSLTGTTKAAAHDDDDGKKGWRRWGNWGWDDDWKKKKGHHCFARGTMIRTVAGERKVEDLAVGDLLPTIFGGDSPIQWIGRYSFKRIDRSKPWTKDVLPVRIAKSALGPDVPNADLLVTQAHALFFDGALVPAWCLINGASIRLDDAHDLDELEYVHIKLERHDIIYAQGAPCETLLRVHENAVNYAEYVRVFGVPSSEPVSCAPLHTFNGGRSEIKSRLRSALSPWIDRREKIDIIRDYLEERRLS